MIKLGPSILALSETSRAIPNPRQALIAPQGLHRVRAPVISNHVECGAGNLKSIANPRAFISNFPALVIEARTVLDLTSLRLRTRIGYRLSDLVPQHHGHTIEIARRRWINEVLPATAAS